MPTPFSYDIEPDDSATPGSGASVVTEPGTTSPIDAFLGFGLVHPFERNQKNDFVSAGGHALLRSAISQILGVEAESEKSHGELPWRPDFGSKLHLLRHRKGRVVEELGRAFILEAIRKWEPRVAITQVQAHFDREGRAASFRVRAIPIEENVPGNRVDLASSVDVDIAL